MMKTEIEVKVLTKDYPSVLPHAHDCLLPMMSDRARSGIAQSIGDPLGCLSPSLISLSSSASSPPSAE